MKSKIYLNMLKAKISKVWVKDCSVIMAEGMVIPLYSHYPEK